MQKILPLIFAGVFALPAAAFESGSVSNAPPMVRLTPRGDGPAGHIKGVLLDDDGTNLTVATIIGVQTYSKEEFAVGPETGSQKVRDIQTFYEAPTSGERLEDFSSRYKEIETELSGVLSTMNEAIHSYEFR